jgi:peptide/nickel transport system permease protein
MRRLGAVCLVLAALVALAAPMLSPNDPAVTFRAFLYAPPMRPRIVGPDGSWHRPFVHPLRLVSRLEQTYEVDVGRAVPLEFFAGGKLARLSDESAGPWLPLGADRDGRDVLARLLFGARTSLGVALLATLAALFIGAVAGGLAGYRGGLVDDGIMRLAEFVLVLPAVYVVLALRSALPLVLPTWAVFALMSAIFAAVGWPWVARAVRSTVAAERTRDYAAAALSLGASPARVLFIHLLPACRGVIGVQAILLLPGFILAEATLSYVGLGFPDTVPSWGSMLHQAGNLNVIADFPWTLAPAAGIVTVTLAANMLVEGRWRGKIGG